ncbi:hypothetical protein ACP4OV_010919 [Aristida adscensionis]
MPNNNLASVSSTNEEEIRRKRRKKRKRVAAVLVIAIMTMISHWYHRKRPRHIVDPSAIQPDDYKWKWFEDCLGALDGTYIDVLRDGRVLLQIQGSHEFIKLPDPSAIQPDDYKWKWFEDCLGALDGTYIDVLVPLRDQGRYKNRKQNITTNVLGVCDRYMRFVYVLAGWEGSASDSRVLRDAMTREDAFAIPNGKYYLVDAGYTNGPGFLAPYRSTRYHLNEWAAQGNNPSTAKELYNLRHASARNVIERTFGLLKMRWAILRTNSYFDFKNQWDMDDLLLHEVDNTILVENLDVQKETNMITNVQTLNEWNNFRDNKADQMFTDYQARRGQQV